MPALPLNVNSIIPQWEYRVDEPRHDDVELVLKLAGLEGWELVSAIPVQVDDPDRKTTRYKLIFKRQKVTP